MVLRAEEDSERDSWMAALRKSAQGADAAGGAAEGGGGGGEEAKYLLQSALEVRADKQRAAGW